MKAKGIYLWNSIKLLCWWHKFDDNPRKWIRDHPVWIGITFSIKSLCCISTWPTSWSYATTSLSRKAAILPILNHRNWIFKFSIMIIRGLQNLWTLLPYVNQLQPKIMLPASLLYYLSPTHYILICHQFWFQFTGETWPLEST